MDNILISGASFIGLLTGISLHLKGFNVEIIEQKPEFTNYDNRGIALNASSVKFLKSINLWDKIFPRVSKINEIRIVDNFSPLFLHFNEELTREDPLGYIIEGQHMREVLFSAIKSHNIKISYNTQIISIKEENTHVNVTLSDDRKMKIKLLIGADGVSSQVRKLTPITLQFYDYKQIAMTLKVTHENHHGNIAIEHFMPNGPFAILPALDGYSSYIVWTEKEKIAEIYRDKLSHSWFEDKLREKFTNYLGKIEIISEVNYHPLKLYFAKKYYHNRMVLLGNAIHNIHPIAGQGMNLAIKDVEIFTILLEKRRKLGLDIDSNILEEFEKNRLSSNMMMILITHGFDTFFSNNNKLIKNIRRIGLFSVNKINKLKNFFINYASGEE